MDLSWNPSLATGVPVLDEQHQALFAQLDALVESIRRGSARAQVQQTLAFLQAYAKEHLPTEEALMRESGFPELAQHRAEHDVFARDMAALDAEYRRDGPSPSLILRVNGRVAVWLREHLDRADRALADYLRARAAKP